MSNENSRLSNYFKLTKKKNPLKITNSPDFFHDSESGHSFFMKYLKNKNILPKINSIQNSTNSTLNFNNFNNTTITNFTNISKRNNFNSRNNESSIYFNNNSKNFEKNFQSLDEKIEKTKEKAKEIFDKKLNTQKEKLKNKENKFEIKVKNKKNILLKLKEKNKNIKEMKDLRLKIQLLINNKIISNCLTFENHIEFFNKKILDYFDSENFIENNLHFHSYFRYDKSEFESHPRLNFIMDLDEIKKNSLNSEKIDFYKDFTQKERKLIENDPTYFLLNKEKFFKNLDFLNISLTKKLNREEKKENKNKFKIFDSFDNSNKNNEIILNENEENDKKKFKNKISIKEKDDIYKNSLIHAKNIINKILYENKKKFLILEKNKEKVNKTMSEMTRKIQELDKPNFNNEINYDFEQIKFKGNFNEKNLKMNKRLRKNKLLTKKMELIKLDKLNFAKIDDNENDFDNNMNEEQKASFNLKQYLEAENREINEYVLKIKQIYAEKK